MTDAANIDTQRQQALRGHISVSDAVLVEQCRDGDSAAMERLIVK